MPHYRSRVFARITVPVMGTRAQRIGQLKSDEGITIEAIPKRTRIERNDHNTADQCELTLDWMDAGVDPRMLDHGLVRVWIDDAGDSDQWEANGANLRFVGIIDGVKRSGQVDAPSTVEIQATDYTRLFLAAKPFGSSGVPDYSQTLEEAWRRIVSQTPGGELLADRIVFQQGDEEESDLASLPLGKAVADRFRKLGKVPHKPETDAWAVWQQCVGMLGLVSWIDLDECIVSTATNYFSEEQPVVLTWGKNLSQFEESRDAPVAGKGLILSSFDPLSGTVIEAYWPPVGDERVHRKKGRAKKKSATSDELRSREDREVLSYPGVTDRAALENVAKLVWEERSRQELCGRVTTAEMRARTFDGLPADLLSLRAGDSIRIDIDANERLLLSRLPTDGARVRYLTQRGFNEATARLQVANMKEFAKLNAVFLTKSVEIEHEVNEEDVSFSIGIEYVNRIQPQGDTD